jgi:hypothetical protein
MKPLPDWILIKNMILTATIIEKGSFMVNPKYPKYWQVVKEACNE